ncbi:drkD [Scenedesmus sp. PABB004]|nr:drkD [Scenedesmus sp. PABB004]
MRAGAAALLLLACCAAAVRAQTCGVAICVTIDESGSIGSTNFVKVKNFVVDLFNRTSAVANSCFNKDSGSDAGILTTTSNAALSRILVLLTAATVRAAGITFVTVGVSSGVDDTFLGGLGQYYKVSNFSGLAAYVESVATGVCTDASVTKAVASTSEPLGNNFTFTVTITNTGKFDIASAAASPMVFTDTLPSGLTFQAGSVAPGAGSPPANCSYTSATRALRCSITSGTLPVGGATSWSYTYTAAATTAGTFSVPTVLSPFRDNNAGNNYASLAVTVTGAATPVSDPTVSVSLSASTVLIGSKLNATVTVTNQSPSVQAINVVTEYTLPAGLDFDNSTSPPAGCSVSGKVLTCAAGNMSASGSAAHVVGLVAVQEGVWDSEAVVDADNDGDATNNGPVVATVTVLATCDVYNPDGTRFGCSAGSIFNTTAGSDPGPDQDTCCITCQVCADFVDQCGSFNNLCGATINCTCSAPKPFCHMPQTPLQPAGPGFCSNSSFNPSPDLDVAITRTVPAAPVLINTTFDTNLTVRVVSGQSGANDVVVVDTLPPGLVLVSVQTPVGTCTPAGSTITCAIGAMALSQSVVVSVRVRATAQGTQSTNATVTATGDTVAANNVDSQAITVICASCASFATAVCGNISNGCGATINCTCSAPKPFCHMPQTPLQPAGPGFCSNSSFNPSPDLDVAITRTVPAAPVLINTTFDTNLTVRVVSGQSGANDVVVVDTLPPGLALVSVQTPVGTCTPAGSTITCAIGAMALSQSVVVSVRVRATAQGTQSTNATVTATGDTVAANNVDSQAITVVCISCTSFATAVCGTISDGCGGTVACTCPSDRPVCSQPGPLQPGSCSPLVLAQPDVSIRQRAVYADPALGAAARLLRAGRPHRTDRAPPACWPAPVDGCVITYPLVKCTYASLSGSRDITIRVKADSPGTFTCVAEVTAINDGNPANNRDSGVVVVKRDVDISITATMPNATVLIGSKLDCTLVVANLGVQLATGVVAKYTLPHGLAFDPSTPLPAGCTIVARRIAGAPRAAQAGGTLSCGPGSVPPGGNVAYVVGVVAVQEGSWDSTARVSATNDTNPSNDGPVKLSITVRRTCGQNSADGAPFTCSNGTALDAIQTSNASPSQATCCEVAITSEGNSRPDVSITASTLNTAVLIGSKLNCTLVVANLGALPATGVVAKYTLPPGLAFDPSTPLPAGCTIGGRRTARQPRSPRAAQAGGTLFCGPGSVPPGGNVAYVVGVVAVQEGSWDSTARVSATNDTNPSNDGPVKLSITVRRTCGQNSADGAPFTCSNGTALNANQVNASPSQAACCQVADGAPDVSITATTPSASILIGSKLNCTLVVANPGTLPATGVVAKYTLPPGLAFDPSTPLPAGCTIAARAAGAPQAGGTLSCGPGSVPPGGNVAYVVGVVAVQEGSWDSTARVSATNDTNPSNDGPVKLSITVRRTCGQNSADGAPFTCSNGTALNANQVNASPSQAACCQVADGAPDVSITATTPSASILIGSKLNCTLVVANPGTLPATGVVAKYTLPPGLAFDPSTPLPAGCTIAARAAGAPQAGGTLSCGPGSVPPGGNVAYVVGVVAIQEGSWDSTARVAATNDTNPSNDGPVKLSITVRRTCAKYYADGTRFGCSTGSSFNATAANDPTPGQQTCCIDCKGCADFASGCGTISDGCGGTLDCGCSGATPFCHQSQALQALSELGYCDAAPFNPGSKLDVLVDKVGPSEPVELGSEFNFLVTVRVVSGPKGANDVTVVDTLPPGLELVSLRTPRGTCTPSGSTITCAFGNMVLSQSVVVTMRVRATAKGMHNTSIATKASDSNPLNNNAILGVQVICSTCDSFPGRCGAIATGCGTIQCGCPSERPVCVQLPGAPTSSSVCNTRSVSPSGRVDVAVMVTGPTSAVVVGREFELLITATVLSGAKGASNVVVTGHIPDGLEVVGVVPDAQCTIQYPSISCAVGALGVGESYSLTVRVKASRDGSFTSSATVSATGDGQKANNRYNARVTVRGQCAVVTQASCASGAWTQGANCTVDVCPQAFCTPDWRMCTPSVGSGSSPCCNPTSACKPVQGLKTRWYACTLGEACRAEGQACGSCPGGASCCDGLTCKWEHKRGNGVCTKPFTCAQDGASCASAQDCCPGSTCGSDGRCRACDCNRACAKHDKACEAERESECKSLSAVVASAVLPGPGGAVIQGMAKLHDKSIVHFDLKTANLLVGMRDKTPLAQVADFGLSKQRQQTFVTEKVDVFSFGVVLWELWTLREPHEGVNYHALLHAMSASADVVRHPMPGSPEFEGDAGPEPAPGWAALIGDCLATAPAARPAFREVVGRLEGMLRANRATKRRTASGPPGAGAAAAAAGPA